MHQVALTQAQQRRLEKLAREAGRKPQSMLQYVLRDGFDLCEEDAADARAACLDERTAGRDAVESDARAQPRVIE